MSQISRKSIIHQVYEERTKEFHQIVIGLSEVEREIVWMAVRRTPKEEMIRWVVEYRIRGLRRGILNSDWDSAETEICSRLNELAQYFKKLVA